LPVDIETGLNRISSRGEGRGPGNNYTG